STQAWCSLDQNIFVGGNASPGDVILFVLDLMLRGGLFDLMEHFELHVGHLIRNRADWMFSLFSFSYRIYVPMFLIATVVRVVKLLRDKFPADANQSG